MLLSWGHLFRFDDMATGVEPRPGGRLFVEPFYMKIKRNQRSKGGAQVVASSYSNDWGRCGGFGVGLTVWRLEPKRFSRGSGTLSRVRARTYTVRFLACRVLQPNRP